VRQRGLRCRERHPEEGVLLFSQYVETTHAARLLAAGSQGVGYLLKDRVADVSEFVSSLERIAAGGTVLDPEVVTQVMRRQPTDRHSPPRTPGARTDGRGPRERRDRRTALPVFRGS
jgi:DNA-binding NarL/FixJ family response regulator